MLGLLGYLPDLPDLASAAGHAHELLFGFALAGYQLDPQPRLITFGLLACGFSAHLLCLLWPGSGSAGRATALFAAGLSRKVVPRFVGMAKRRRNQTVAPPWPLAVSAASLLLIGTGGLTLLRW